MRNLLRVGNFWNKSDKGLIKCFKERARMKESLDNIAYINLNSIPKLLKEKKQEYHKVQELYKAPFETLLPQFLYLKYLC